MKSLKNMDDKILKCCLLYEGWKLRTLYVSEVDLIITFCKDINIQENKIKSTEKLLSKLKKIRISRITKRAFITPNIKDRRWFEIKQSEIMELLDCQCYETGN